MNKLLLAQRISRGLPRGFLLVLTLASSVLISVSASAACPATGSAEVMQKCISKQVKHARRDFINHFNQMVGQPNNTAGYSFSPAASPPRPQAKPPRSPSAPAAQQPRQQQPAIHIHYD